MKAQDIMSRMVVGVRADTDIEQAIKIMLDRHMSGLPVLDKSESLIGIVTEGDFMQRPEVGVERRRPRWLQFLLSPGRLADEYTHTHGRKVEEVMTTEVITANMDTPLEDIIHLMSRNRIKRIPIVSGSKVVGIVTRADVLRALSTAIPHQTPNRKRSDGDILQDIHSEFDRVACIPAALIDASVHEGVVDLRGSITDERERRAVRVAVENIPGVSAVHDHLIWVEPTSGLVLLSPEDEGSQAAVERAAE